MMLQTEDADTQDKLDGILHLGLLAVVAAVAIGLLGGLFRLTLQYSSNKLQQLYQLLHGMQPLVGFGLLCLLVTSMTFAAIYLVRAFAPNASGSGIQRVEAIWRKELPIESNWAFLPVKFVSGLLAITAGYALGREGPIVQMGAHIGGLLGKLSKTTADQRTLIAGLSGAGLAVAFNAPLGGMLFTLEELARHAHTRLVIVSMLACSVAVPVAQLLIGTGEIFPVPYMVQPDSWALLLLAVLDAISGLLGALYNTAILRCLDGFTRTSWLTLWQRALLAAIALSLVLWQIPRYSGGGEALVTQLLTEQQLFAGLAMLWLVRFVLGPLSYSLGMSGGLFAPMLAVGAIQGTAFGLLVEHLWPGSGLNLQLCTVVGMAAMFSASVRAPLTGTVLIIEMTGLGNQALSLMAACIPAAVVPFWLGKESIYDDLRRRLFNRPRNPEQEAR